MVIKECDTVCGCCGPAGKGQEDGWKMDGKKPGNSGGVLTDEKIARLMDGFRQQAKCGNCEDCGK